MSRHPTWGLVATVKAPVRDILNFAAWHLDLGAHRLHVYLDAPDDAAVAALKSHPKCRVTVTDAAFWQRRRPGKGAPEGHQHRQTLNATDCYRRGPQVDWLGHIDVDEFLWPATPLAGQLAALPEDTLSARVHPVEALAPDPADPPPESQIWCKGHARKLDQRRVETNAIYPTYGEHLNGGFLSHVAGKVFVRTGRDRITLRIHNAFVDKVQDPDPPHLQDTRLVHLHAKDWAHWQAAFRYRLTQGAYRAGLAPAPMADGIALTMNQLFAALLDEGGEDALRAFYTEVCTATPELRARLAQYGHLHAVTLDLDARRARHFPDHT